MVIDNFGIFRERLTFTDKTDRYIVHVLCRPKDIPEGQRTLGANEHQRLLRTYYIDSIEYFDRKEESIKTLCRQNHARAYVLPQVRNNYECLLSLGEKVLETIRLGNWSVKPEHLMRAAYCGYHKSRDKRWILDLDSDNMSERIAHTGVSLGPGEGIQERSWSVDGVLELVKAHLGTCGKCPDDAYVVPTKSGHHIVTPPFDLQMAFRNCRKMFEGPGGWLHKDGMSLLFYDSGEVA